MAAIRLGLIGDNIRESRSPDLHRLAGAMTGLDVSYDLLIPAEMGLGFKDVFAACRDRAMTGVNVTLPYKERVVEMVRVDDPAIARIGSVNTVTFASGGARGFNTDYSGFVSAYRHAFGDAAPGRVALIGAGGVGRAIAFGLLALGAAEIVLIDTDRARAGVLAAALSAAGVAPVRVAGPEALPGADGVVNATPLGMVGYPGSPVPEGAFPKGSWAFDAVYTPVATPFRTQALAAGARFLSGWELFFFQGVDAFALFTGRRPDDLTQLRVALRDPRLQPVV